MAPILTFGFPYYGNTENLLLHYAAWKALTPERRAYFDFVIVDDGSPDPLFPLENLAVNLRIFRIHEDIPFNFSGAKNLIFEQARTEWILVTDIDHVLNPAAVDSIIAVKFSDYRTIYSLGRIFPVAPLPETRPEVMAKQAIPSTLIVNHRAFILSGGYDEDFAGYYGKEDSLFRRNLIENHRCKLQHLETVKLSCHECRYTDSLRRSRDLTRNLQLFDRKIALGTKYQPGPRLRFEWSKSFESACGL